MRAVAAEALVHAGVGLKDFLVDPAAAARHHLLHRLDKLTQELQIPEAAAAALAAQAVAGLAKAVMVVLV
jgi:hypothetical protein